MYARFEMTAPQSIPNNMYTQINWGKKTSYNGENFCEVDLATGKIKILKAGMYQLQIIVQFQGNSAGKRGYWGIVTLDVLPITTNMYISVSEFTYASANTLLNNQVIQTSGISLDILAGSNTICVIRKISN